MNVSELFHQVPPWGWVVLAAVMLGGLLWGFLPTGGSSSKRHADSDDRWRESSSRWARVSDVRDLVLRRGEVVHNRTPLGMLDGKRLAARPNRSVMALAPSGSGKTPRVVVPTVLRHEGPAVVASVKADVLHLTKAHRASQGRVMVFDPTGATGEVACRWSPLMGVQRYSDAERAATWLCESSKVEGRGLEGQQYWDSLGRRCLAPVLYVAAKAGRSMADVARLIQNSDSITQALHDLGDQQAIAAWAAHVAQDSRPKTSVEGTAWVILEPWTSEVITDTIDTEAPSERPVLDIAALLDGSDTLYLVAPAAEQALYTPIFETLVNAILRATEARAQATGLPLDPALLLALDEAANIAPLRRLDQLASKGQGEGVLVLTVWQDVGQIVATYGHERARTIRANHWATIYLPGINDQETLRGLAEAIGEDRVKQTSYSTQTGGGTSATTSYVDKLVATPAWLRRLPVDEGIIISGRYPAIRATFKGWFEDSSLRPLVDRDIAAQFDAQFAPRSRRRRTKKPVTTRPPVETSSEETSVA